MISKLNNIQKKFLNQLLTNNEESFQSGFSIYQNAFYERLINILKEHFLNLANTLGIKKFRQLAVDYIQQYPPQQKTAQQFGEHLAKFMQQQHFAEHLIDLARLEWAAHQAFIAKDSKHLQLNNLAEMKLEQWDNLLLQFHPSVHILEICDQAFAIWQQQQQNHSNKKITVILWRKDLQIYSKQLTSHEIKFTNAILNKKKFAEICDVLNEDEQEKAAQQLSLLLNDWINKQIFLSYDKSDELYYENSSLRAE